MQRRDYVLLSLCTPFMTVWMAKRRSVNYKWKEETTIFYVCSCFCFLGCCCCCCCFLHPQISVGMAKRATFPNNICKEKIIIFHFFSFCALRKCLLEWTSNVFNQRDAKRRLSSFCLFVFIAYPANVRLNAKWRFHTIYAKRKLSFRSFYFVFVFWWAPRNCLLKWPSEFF